MNCNAPLFVCFLKLYYYAAYAAILSYCPKTTNQSFQSSFYGSINSNSFSSAMFSTQLSSITNTKVSSVSETLSSL